MQFIDNIPLSVLLFLCILLGLAPFAPEPHIVEKLRMLIQGNMKNPIDIFEFLYHSAPFFPDYQTDPYQYEGNQ
jgi:hypothetical protein